MKYHDGSFLTGNFGRGNRFHGLVRYFDSKVKLQGIISVEKREISKEDVVKNDFLWKRMDKQELENFIMLKSFNKDRIFILNKDFKGDVTDCKATNSYFFEDCYKITTAPLMSSSSCNPLISNEIQDIKRKDEIKSFRFNLLQNETYTDSDPLYPFCIEKESFNKDDIRKSIEVWWNKISLPKGNPIWFHSYSKQPFQDPTNPHIEINLNYFAGRNNFKNKPYKIHSHTKLLQSGKLKDGKILANVSSHDIDDWIGPIKIQVGRFKTNITVGVDAVELQKHIIVFGQLHMSKLNGFVRIMGILPNDPKDDCDQHTSSEFGFVGQYKSGVPSGYCWKRLLGGSFIYGKVDENGDFSGDNIAYINQDIATSFKGTFKNGVMVKAQQVDIVGERCNDEGIKVIEFSAPLSRQEYHYERPTSKSFGDQPLVVDPLDDKYIRLGDSAFETDESSQGSGQNGAFANVDIPPGTMIGHNNGFIYSKEEMDALKLHYEEVIKKKADFYKKVEEDEAIANNTIASFREGTWKYRTGMKCGMTLDIPLQSGQDSTMYRSTRGHKINHSFAHSNAHLTSCDSARYGIVSCIMSRPGITIAKGSELFITYGYGYTSGPKWYKKLFTDFLYREEPSRKSTKGSLKDCHFKDGSPMDSEQCDNYLTVVKNRYLKVHNVSEDKKVNEEIYNMILKSHQAVGQRPMQKHFSDQDFKTLEENNIQNMIAS